MKNFIPFSSENNKEFKKLEQLLTGHNQEKKTFYKIIYKDGSYEELEVETGAEAFKQASKQAEVKSINLCYRPLAN
jgi:hypothetical protein